MKIGVIGVGEMGSMLVSSYYRFTKEPEHRLIASDSNPARLAGLSSACPALRISDNVSLASGSDVVFVCVPPGPYLDVAREIAPALTSEKLFVCITSGVELDVLGGIVPCRIVKLIPNVAHAVGRGVALMTKGPRASDADIRFLTDFMRPMSRPLLIDEAEARVAGNITGCGPAILASFCNLFVDMSARFAPSLERATLMEMMREMFLATAQLCEQGATFDSIVANVSTMGGITETAVQTLAERLPDSLTVLIQRTMERERKLKSNG
ncbi:pyrroline-5-carboxylate reductase family protein [Candidatus Deferrimicrobium sp.]|uniref:pyrroline-5-carboxylate reductase family protein n=1 Tax=Candidatus Deferrimicrobium sp. TaxID=3060586 RepID=UPI003C563A1A